MRILRQSSFRTMPWKNGGGETTEIAVFPEGAGMDDFDWRVSMARVATDGPFSIFPGIDRSLTLLEGVGMMLAIDGHGSVHLTVESPPLAFPGDAPTTSVLTDGAILDLNVMTRRGVRAASVARERGARLLALDPAAADFLVLLRGGSGEIRGATIDIGDAVLLERGGAPTELQIMDGATAYVIRIA